MSAQGVAVRTDWTETLIGLAVVLVAVALIVFGYMRTGTGSLSSGYEIDAHLSKADGLGVGTDVRLSGIKVGSVTDLTLDPRTYLVTVHMHIRNDVKIPTDSSLMVTSAGILGSSYLSITPGGDDAMILPHGFIENTQGAVDLMSLAGRMGLGNLNDVGKAKPAQRQPPAQGQQPAPGQPAPLPPGP